MAGQRSLTVHFPGAAADESVDPTCISELLHQTDTLIWLDVEAPDAEDLEFLRQEFGFHSLALEDVERRHQRPKVDVYRGYYFVVIYALSKLPTGAYEMAELALFWGHNYLVTVHVTPLPEIGEGLERWRRDRGWEHRGIGFLVYRLIDSVVDAYFPSLDQIAEQLEDLEEDVFREIECLDKLFALRKRLLAIRRVLGPTRDVVNLLTRDDAAIVDDELRPYFSDVYDHTVRIMEGFDIYRELLAATLDTHLSITSYRLNRTMKTMTAITTMLMVAALIAGIYGMN
ncbi:MAG: magnesium transporter CorA family protein, partial [Chloroflexi bacterium]|nr:magnesium transporter CorA family protein [Chloroflexota bacterium]